MTADMPPTVFLLPRQSKSWVRLTLEFTSVKALLCVVNKQENINLQVTARCEGYIYNVSGN